MTEQVLLTVDGNSLAHRAFHGYESTGMSTVAGQPVYAVYGFFALLAGICDKVSPDAVVVGFDDHTSSVRRQRCPQYKAQREAKSPDLCTQMDDIRAILGELGVPVIVPEGLEADDVLGSAAAAVEATDGWRCVIATSDRDAFSQISERTTVLRLQKSLDNAVEMTPQALFSKYGVHPHQYVQFAALRGDPSDNLPGVAGIGEKTAAKLLAGTGTLQAALDDAGLALSVVGKAAAAKLQTAEARENLARNLDIMTILRDVAVEVRVPDPRVSRDTVERVLRAWGIPKLVARVGDALCGDVVRPAPVFPEDLLVESSAVAVWDALPARPAGPTNIPVFPRTLLPTYAF